jgi:hypothetical protein
MTPAENDPIAAREHIEIEHAIAIGVRHLGLRLKDGELPLDRHELLIAEQGLGPETGAVDDQRGIERLHAGNVGNLRSSTVAPCLRTSSMSAGKKNRSVSAIMVLPAGVRRWKRMLAWTERGEREKL